MNHNLPVVVLALQPTELLNKLPIVMSNPLSPFLSRLGHRVGQERRKPPPPLPRPFLPPSERKRRNPVITCLCLFQAILVKIKPFQENKNIIEIFRTKIQLGIRTLSNTFIHCCSTRSETTTGPRTGSVRLD